MKRFTFLTVMAGLLLGGVCPILPSNTETWLVTKVIDGDTIVANGQRIRYIGINTPEINRTDKLTRTLGQKAKAYNESLVLNKSVDLKFSDQEKDKYGRLLAYVYVGDTLVNAEMISAGYASASNYPQRYADLFRKLEQEARQARRGLWACE